MHLLKRVFEIGRDDALRFASARGFGVVVAAGTDGPRGSHVPFVITTRDDGATVVQIHFTANNPLVDLADGRNRFLLVVTGADAYVSNDWYVSPDQVSTWLYEAVHLSGVAHLRSTEENRPHGDDLLAEAEGRVVKQPWTLQDMEPAKREAMLSAIRVIDILVDSVEGQSKMNQHKIDADHVAIANKLASSQNPASRELAAKMRALRGHLTYNF